MDLQNAVIKDVTGAVTVYSQKGERAETKDRVYYGLSFCIDSGRIVYTQNGVEYVEDKTHAVILPQGKDYSLYREVSGAFPVINFSTAEPLCDTITVIEVHNNELLVKSYEEIKKLFASGGSRAKILSHFYDMLDGLSSQSNTAIIDPALKFLYENYNSGDVSNELLAKKCKISEVYFRRLFKESVGISPKKYVLTLRIEKAKQMLSEGRERVQTIADKCGFESGAHFSRTFKKHVGMTPAEYRIINRNGII